MAPVAVQALGARLAVANVRARNVQARAIDYGASRRTSGNVDATQRRSAAQRASRSPHARAAYTPPQPSSYSSNNSYSSNSYSSSSYSSTPSGKANPIDYGAARRSSHSVNPVTRMSAAQRASRSPTARATYTPPQPSSYEAPSSYSSSSYSSASYTPSGKANPIDYGAARRTGGRSRSPTLRSQASRSYSAPPPSSYSSDSYSSSSSSYSSSPASYTPSGKANPIDYGAARRSGGRSRSPTLRNQASRSYSSPPPSSYSSDSYSSSSSSYSSASYTASGKANPVDYGAARRSQTNVNPAMRNSAAQRAARRSSAGNSNSGSGFW